MRAVTTMRTASRNGRPLAAALLAVGAWLGGCGGGSPLGNPPPVSNPPGGTGEHLSFAYFEKCIQPILLAQLPIIGSGGGGTNTCASAGCHAAATGTGGALRIVPTAVSLDLHDPANTPDVIRASDMYKNFYSSQAATVPGNPDQSRLFDKPLLRNVLHGGGLIFVNDQDPNARLINYWISHPAPAGQDEFSTATWNMFTPADPETGTCNTQ